MSAVLPVSMTFSVCSLYFIAAYDDKVPLVAAAGDLACTGEWDHQCVACRTDLDPRPSDTNLKGPVCDAMLL